MFSERLKEAKKDHDILDAKMDKCNDGIQSICTGEKENNKMLRTIQDNTNFICEHI
jgi:hypothetical protein